MSLSPTIVIRPATPADAPELRLRARRLGGDHQRRSRRERVAARLHRPRRALSARS